MPVPVQSTAIAAQAQGLLISQYAPQPNIAGIVKTIAGEIQNLENAIFSLISGMQLSAQPLGGGNWDILDKLGALVGQPRNGMADLDYVAAIKIRVRVNKSDGLANDIIQITSLLVAGAVYSEYPTAGFEVYVGVVSNSVINALVADLGGAKPAGVSCYVRWAAPGPLWSFSDKVSGTLGTPLEDFVSKLFPNAFASLSHVTGT